MTQTHWLAAKCQSKFEWMFVDRVCKNEWGSLNASLGLRDMPSDIAKVMSELNLLLSAMTAMRSFFLFPV